MTDIDKLELYARDVVGICDWPTWAADETGETCYLHFHQTDKLKQCCRINTGSHGEHEAITHHEAVADCKSHMLDFLSSNGRSITIYSPHARTDEGFRLPDGWSGTVYGLPEDKSETDWAHCRGKETLFGLLVELVVEAGKERKKR